MRPPELVSANLRRGRVAAVAGPAECIPYRKVLGRKAAKPAAFPFFRLVFHFLRIARSGGASAKDRFHAYNFAATCMFPLLDIGGAQDLR